MTLKEWFKFATMTKQMPQPEGKEVVEAYESGEVVMVDWLAVTAFLLSRVRMLEDERKAIDQMLDTQSEALRRRPDQESR